MKIAIMGGWNVGSGASIHSELIGRELAKDNYLTVLTFYEDSSHGLCATGKDEDYVVRCFTKYGDKNPQFDKKPFLKDYNLFIVEDLGMLPIERLKEVFPEIKKKARTINVIHDGRISRKSGFYDLDFDAVVCFDGRYKEFLKEKYSEEKIHIIPYPSYPLNPGNKEKAREKLDLPKDKKIIFSFGRLADYMGGELELMDEETDKQDIVFLVVSSNEKVVNNIKNCPKIKSHKYDLKLIEKDLDIEELHTYLYASDALIFPKDSSLNVVVSSTIFQCLGSLCAIIAKDSNFVEMFSNEIWKYSDWKEFKSALEKAFERGEDYEKLNDFVKKYLEKYDSKEIAKMFEGLFKELGVKDDKTNKAY